MRFVKIRLKIAAILIVLLLSSSNVFAIGFDAEETYDSVFAIHTEYGFGSGFAIGSNAIITNAHVVEDADNIFARAYTGEEYKVRIYEISSQADLALLVADGSSFNVLTLGSTIMCRAGDDVYAIGTPSDMALAWTLTKGVISSLSRVFDNQSYIQIDAAINSGNSGGPLLNENGKVVGINTFKLIDSEGIGFSIPVETLIIFINSLSLQTDENGNIISTISIDDETPGYFEGDPLEEPTDDIQTHHYSRGIVVLLTTLLCLSVALNLVLAIKLVNKKNRKRIMSQKDSSERTNFEIEIEEQVMRYGEKE